MKILIVTYYWPPAGGPGVQRWLAFVKYLRDFGITPILYVPENPKYPTLDASIGHQIPEGIEVIKRPIFEPYQIANFLLGNTSKTISKGIITDKKKQSFIEKILLYIRGNFFIPDARKFWIKPSIRFLKQYLSTNQIDFIITTGPPHSLHLIGNALKKDIKIPWVADFRDPWTTIGYHNQLKLTKRSHLKHKSLEKEVLTNADHILVTSYTTQKEFEEITKQPVTVITNGFDDYRKNDKHDLDKMFTISHIGSLLSGRNPTVLWKVLNDICKENKLFASRFRLQLIGNVSQEVVTAIQNAGLKPFLFLKSYVPHDEAMTIQKQSQVLLLIEINSTETRCIIPGKIFEYMNSGRPIIAMGPKGSDIEKILLETDTGYFFEYHEYNILKAQILTYFQMYCQDNLNSHVKDIHKYSRKALTKSLANVLNNIYQTQLLK